MSENIYDILAKFPKDLPTSSMESEPIYESVDPQDDILAEAQKLAEKFEKYKATPNVSTDKTDDSSDFKVAKAKRELQLAMAAYPEAGSPIEALVARMGDQAEETKKVIDSAKATIVKQQKEIDQTAQAVNDANARYDAQEKRFQEFNQEVAASELDVKQQAQAALAFAKQPNAKPQDIIAKTQAQAPTQPAAAEPVAPAEPTNIIQFPTDAQTAPEQPTQTTQQQPAGQSDFAKTAQQLQNQPKFKPRVISGPEGERKVTQPRPGVTRVQAVKPSNVTNIGPSSSDISDFFGASNDEEELATGTLGEANETQPQYPEDSPALGQFNLDKLKKAWIYRLPKLNLVFGPNKIIKLTGADIYAISSWFVVKSGKNNEIAKNLAAKNLSNFDHVQRLLATNEINDYRSAWAKEKRSIAQRRREKLVKPLDFNAPKPQPTPAADKYTQQPVVQPKKGQLKLFNGKQDMKNLDQIQESLMERFMSFKEEAKPDFLDLDKDGDTEEPMKKAAKDAKEHEPAKPDSDAVAKRKRLQALKDKQEDERAEKGDYDTKSSTRVVKGRAYGGSAQKDDEEKDLDESGLQAYLGKKKYGKEGMKALQKAGREGASKEKMALIRAKHDKMEEAQMDEVNYSATAARAGKDIGKPGKAFAKIAKSAGERYGSKERGEKVAGVVLKKLRANEGEDHEGMRKPTKANTPEYHTLPVDKAAAEKRKQLQALKDKQEDQRMAKELNKDLGEVAPPGAKAERMVKHIKKGYSKDGKLTPKEKGIAYATAWKAHNKGQLAESRNHESSEYTYETVGRILCDEQPHLDCNSEAFVKAVYDELIELKMTPKAARWLCHHDEDFLSDTASAYKHFCDSKEKEAMECGAPINSFVSEEPVVDAVQELDEIARLAGLAPKMEAKCSSCGCADCECNESSCMVDESAITEAATRKDFRMVADLLKAIPDMAKRTELALYHADIFKQQNSRFKKEMFLAAAGVDTTPIKDESIETEGNAFTGKLAATEKGGEFELDGKKFKDTSDLEEEVASEGNEFSGALAKAKAAGEKEFEVDGKKYTVKEDINLNVSANGEEDVVNLIRKLSGMPVVAIQAQPAVAEELVAEEGPKERDIEYTNSPREDVAGTDAAIPAGADLNRAKKQYKKEYPGDNPMAVAEAKEEQLWRAYESMINDVKA